MNIQKPAYDDISQTLAKQLGADVERKLHPKSWLFIVFDNLFSFVIIPIMFIASSTNGTDGFSFLLTSSYALIFFVVMVIFLLLFPTLHLLSFRFQIVNGEMRARWGIIRKQKRHLPLAKIHNVSIHQPFFHRLFNVAIVNLESAGSGQESELVFKVLSYDEALLLEQALTGSTYDDVVDEVYEHQPSDSNPDVYTAQEQEMVVNNPLLQQIEPTPQQHRPTLEHTKSKKRLQFNLDRSELVRYGLISNTGIAFGSVLAVIFSPERITIFVMQLLDLSIPNDIHRFDSLNQFLFGSHSLFAQIMIWLSITLSILMSIIVFAKIASVISAFLKLYDFELIDNGTYVSIEKGLFNKHKSRVPVNKIQIWRVQETILHRVMKRQTLKLDTAILSAHGSENDEERGISELVPVATPEQIQDMLTHWNQPTINDFDYHPVHHKAWRRICFPSVLFTIVTAILAVVIFPAYSIPVLILAVIMMVLIMFISKKRADNMGVVITSEHVIWRDGWLTRTYCIAELEHAHALSIAHNPFDRRFNMQTLIIDTVGGVMFNARLTLKYLEKDTVEKITDIVYKACK